jgi:hypothetical protein
VSGGVEDAKGLEGQFPYYRYGGMVRLDEEGRGEVLMCDSGKIGVRMDR